MTKAGKCDVCWNCGHRLDRPYQGRSPGPCGCRAAGCVVCPQCGEPLCAYAKSDKAQADKQARAERLKTMASVASGRGSGGWGGSGSSAAAPEGRKAHLPAVDPFPVGVFPSALQDYVNETARAFGCPPDYVGMAILAVAAAAIGDSREIEVKTTYRTSPSLYAAIVGPPGATKSPVFGFVSHPVDERQQQLLLRFRKEWREYEAARDKVEVHQRQARRKGQSEGDQAGFTVERARKTFDRAEQPVLQRITTSDTTVEALSLILAENPRGLLLKRDELIAWVRGMDMYRQGKGTDRQFYLSGWSGAPFVLDRKGNKDRIPVLVPRCFLVVVGCLTPDLISEFADERGRDDGFLDRILWTYPDVQLFTPWNEEVVSEAAQNEWLKALQRLWGLQPDQANGGPKPVAVGMTPSAKRAWVELYDRLGREAAAPDFPAHLRGAWSKLKVYGARLALILHQLRLACGEGGSGEMVDEASVRGAAALVDYFRSHALRVHAAMAPGQKLPPVDAALVEAVERLVAAGGGSWSGRANELLQALQPHAGGGAELHGWPTSPESMGRAIRRVAGNLEREKRVRVELPGPTDKTRVLALRQLPEPPKPPATELSPAPQITGGPDGPAEKQ